MQVQLWTAFTGLVKGDRIVQEALAATTAQEDANTPPPEYPVIWLTENPLSLSSLPLGSRWVLWDNTSSPPEPIIVNRDYPGITVQSEQPLQSQLQKSLR